MCARNVHPSVGTWASSESLKTRPCWVNYFSVRWAKKGETWVRVGAENREESCAISVPWLSAKGFFAPLVTMQGKHCKCRFEEKAGMAWIVWNASAGRDIGARTPPWLQGFAQVHGDAETVHVLQSWKIFLLLPSCPGHHRISSHPQKWSPLFMCVCINTRAHTALPPSGLLTTKGGCKFGLGWGFLPQVPLTRWTNLIQTQTQLCLPDLEVPGLAGKRGQAAGVSKMCAAAGGNINSLASGSGNRQFAIITHILPSPLFSPFFRFLCVCG